MNYQRRFFLKVEMEDRIEFIDFLEVMLSRLES